MKPVRNISLIADTREEELRGLPTDFPYLASCAELNDYPCPEIPWHWHSTAELFYIKRGTLEYQTPEGTFHFAEGSGGLLLPEVLHKTSWDRKKETVQWIHLFEPSLLFGREEGRMAQKYMQPMLAENVPEMIMLSPEVPEQAGLLGKIRDAFFLEESDWDYEFRLREALCEIWLGLYRISEQSRGPISHHSPAAEIKRMLRYIRQHCGEPLTVEQIAESAHISRRTCYRIFREVLHATPNEYIRSCRIHRACSLLAQGGEAVTQIALDCGFGSAAYFGRIFREVAGCSPLEYRKMAQKY